VPFPEDDYNWASQRIAAGIEQFRKAFEFDPVLWKRPITRLLPIPILHWRNISM
jgi:hypothetical protein